MRGARGCGGEAVVEADAAASGGVSLDVSAGGPAPLETSAPTSAPARTWDVLLDAGCSSEEPIGTITLYTQRERGRLSRYSVWNGCSVLPYLKEERRMANTYRVQGAGEGV